jgi:hypothetical protein
MSCHSALERNFGHACHALPAGSGVFAGVQEVLFYNAFSSCEFTTARFNSKYLLTETLTFCSGQLIASTASRIAARYSTSIAAAA